MKKIFLAIGLAAAFSPAFAQHKHGQEYNKSVFRNPVSKRNSDAIRKTNAAATTAFPQWGIATDKANGTIRDIYGPAITITGSDNLQRAQNCMTEKLSGLGVNPAQWVMTRNTQTDKAGYVDFSQVIDGHKVAFSSLGFRFTQDGRLVRVKMKNYGEPQNYSTPTLNSGDALTAATQDLTGSNISSSNIDADWVWFPVPTVNGYELHPAWAFQINGTDLNREEMQLRGYVDGITGEVLYRRNDVKFDYDLTVKAMIYVNGTSNPATLEPLPHMKLTVNGTNQLTDNLGYFANTTLNIPDLTTVILEGSFSKVRDVPSSNTVPSMQENIITLGSTYTYPTTGIAKSRHLNAFYHVNKVHDYMKTHYPLFTDMDNPLNTNVDLTTSYCNAFYNGSSINFYAAANGCNSFAEINDIVYHEYGHGINDKFYQDQGAGGMNNGALNEGYADVWGFSITNHPVLGQNSTVGGGFIRRYDLAPKVYPEDIEGEVHADGEIIAGAWWDVRLNIGNVDTMAKIFAQTLFDTPDGPDGTEGEVFFDVLISALMADDDDANINNGTPHFLEIVQGFAEHGIYLLSETEVTHNEVDNQWDNGPVVINATLDITYQPFLKDVQLMYRVRPNTGYTAITMTDLGNLNFTATIPAQVGTKIIDYYFAVRDTLSIVNAYGPTGFNAAVAASKSNIPYQFGIRLLGQSYEHFESPATSWTIGNFAGLGSNPADAATSGKWIQAVPLQSSAGVLLSQTGADHTSGSGQCLVTGNAASVTQGVGTADVDGGKTTALSPIINISGFDTPIIEYYRWYSNNRGSNPGTEKWEVKIGIPTAMYWPSVENTYVSDQSWRRRIFNVRDYLPTANEVQLQFIANDATNNQGCVVEAAVDDFVVYDRNWPSSVSGTPNIEKAKIYPNPADENVKVALPASGFQSGTIGIFDLTGRKVQEINMQAGVREYTLNTSALSAGTYFLMIQAEKMIQSQKITIVH